MFGEDAIAQQLAEARSQLDVVRQTQQDHQVPPVTAEAADGRIKITLGANGRVDRIEFTEVRVLKEGTEYLEEELRTLVNTALDARAETLAADTAAPDLEALGEAVAKIQDQGLAQMRAMSTQISAVMKKLQGGA
ncbi:MULTISPECIES: YbaB/EbfC family nucleoid-associated protein [Glycomyces]|uniref:DNA-binding protein YbaB n=2 Tax=Glycomyces TaxID=58113 RepID=A0A9X3STY2_9ACTN|nr:YbaB/EbfC family nucleoid-associated protein [Glycomyces lechevalierae]MDA1384314.1 YbaB/EbfC family nucleoid-associated protein [Glycomyces lechevalierae]MDR7339254.1 DNA-binding protein YbaB [Glycomyces lechevalierae]